MDLETTMPPLKVAVKLARGLTEKVLAKEKRKVYIDNAVEGTKEYTEEGQKFYDQCLTELITILTEEI